ncbi:hypothetical protein GCM10027341_52600 [Spirosoma knui]
MNQTDPIQPDSDVDELPTSAHATTDVVPRRSFRDVLNDKRFWMIAPVLLLALGSTGYFLVAGTRGPQQPLINNVNTSIPNAQTDSVPKSKLELQAAEQRSMTAGRQTVNGMQTGVATLTTAPIQSSAPATGMPTTLDPYLYKTRQPAESMDPALAAMDSLYEPAPRRPRRGSGGQVAARHRTRSGPAFSDLPLSDAINDEPVRPRDIQKQVDERQRLLALLTEYKRDKEAKAAAARDGERPRKAESGAVVSTLDMSASQRFNGFYGLYSSSQKEQQEAALTDDLGTIRAVIHQDQQITDGGRVQLRLLEPVTVRGVRIPDNTLVYGIGSFGTERVGIVLTSLQYEGRIFPIKLSVHDMDGMPGVFVPNVLAAQEGKQALGQTLGGVNYNLSGASTGTARAAATLAGISAAQSGLSGARGLLHRKITQQKATLKGNYYVLLK